MIAVDSRYETSKSTARRFGRPGREAGIQAAGGQGTPQAADGTAMDPRNEHVQRIQERIKSGTYEVDARAVASAIVARLLDGRR